MLRATHATIWFVGDVDELPLGSFISLILRRLSRAMATFPLARRGEGLGVLKLRIYSRFVF